jgi:enoyl-CoA hydratase
MNNNVLEQFLATNTLESILLDPIEKKVLVIRLNRPQAKNALTTGMLKEIASILEAVTNDDNIGAVVITGGNEVFAAGADLQEMAKLDMIGVLNDERPAVWRRIYQFKKPLLAAVNGYALGGGCELAMHADIIIAGEDAQFGQPEINLGIIPGAGGTQRLIRAVGKSVAMKLVLSGEFIGADEAKQTGLVAEVVNSEDCIKRTIELAQKIARKPAVAVAQAKEVLLKAFETDLESGLLFERKAFTVLAATEDRNEGIQAFLEKRKPVYKGR